MNYPVKLQKTETRSLLIEWDDGSVQEIPFRVLRDNCRCATCNAKRQNEIDSPTPQGSLRVLSPAETMPLDILKMHPIGNYAYSIHFSDGHSSGIYAFEMLKSLE